MSGYKNRIQKVKVSDDGLSDLKFTNNKLALPLIAMSVAVVLFTEETFANFWTTLGISPLLSHILSAALVVVCATIVGYYIFQQFYRYSFHLAEARQKQNTYE